MQFSKDQVTFLLTCLRSEAKMDSFCVGTCNPNPDSWLRPILEWYLDDEGTPRDDRAGAIRYFVVLDGDFIFGDSEKYFQENYPDAVNIHNPITGEDIYIPPKKFSFIPGNIFDNPALIAANPRYLSELQNLPDHERARQLWGNWYARPTGSNYFERGWLKVVDSVPAGSRCVRAWDKASEEPSEKYKHPDFTASVKMYKDKDGYYYLCGDYIDENYSMVDNKKIYGIIRKRVGERDTLIKEQSLYDGEECTVVLPRDPSAAGKSEILSATEKLVVEGLKVTEDPMPSNKSKLVKFSPFASAAQMGLVYIVKNTFPEETYEYLMSNLEGFDGERSTSNKKDDLPDCVASAFNAVSKVRTIPTPVLPSSSQSTKSRLDTLRSEVGRTSTVGTPQSYNMNKNLNK